jgi:hypothetical protein
MNRVMALTAAAVLGGALTLTTAGVAGAATYDAVTDFSLSSNPNGQWTYGYDAQGSSHDLLDTTSASGVGMWWNGGSIPNSVIVGANKTGATQSYSTIVLPNNTMVIDPESFTALVVFQAPTTGTYMLTGAFSGVDTGENGHPVSIDGPSGTVFSSTISAFDQSDPFSTTLSLTAGDVVEFAVHTGSSGCTYCNLSTGLTATFTIATNAAPEPSTWALMAAGFAGLGFVGHRRARKATLPA